MAKVCGICKHFVTADGIQGTCVPYDQVLGSVGYGGGPYKRPVEGLLAEECGAYVLATPQEMGARLAYARGNGTKLSFLYVEEALRQSKRDRMRALMEKAV